MTENDNATLEMNPTEMNSEESRPLSAVAYAAQLEELSISHPPGELEAAAIREDHATATAGMRAFVRMGFRLMDVKSRLPHGEYIPWCDKHLKGLSRRHLHRAKFVAEYFSQMCPVGTFEELPPKALELIDGTGGGQSLMAALQDFPEITGSEADAKKACESRWDRHPEERDDWEPRVLSGELSYLRAIQGMLGSEATAGKPRGEIGVFPNLFRAANLMIRHFGAFDTMTAEAKTSFLVSLSDAMEKAPDDVKKAVRIALNA
jgi:hypothetical protein